MAVRFLSVGDRALTIEFGDVIDRGLSREVLRLDRAIRAAPPAGVVETVPTFRSLTVHYDPLATSRADLERAIAGLLDRAEGADAGARLWRIPVCYAGEFAPDLAEVARLTGLAPRRGRRTAQQRALSRLHAGVSAGVSLYGRPAGRARLAAARRSARAGSRRLGLDRHQPDRDLSL